MPANKRRGRSRSTGRIRCGEVDLTNSPANDMSRRAKLAAILITLLGAAALILLPAVFRYSSPRNYRPELLLSSEVQLLMRADSPIANYEERMRKAVTDEDVLLLGRCMNSKNPSVQLGAAQLLGIMDKRGARGVAGLLLGLEASDDFVRSASARALGRIGEFSEQAVPALTRLLDDKSASVQKSAAEALASFGTQPANRASP